MGDRKPKDGSSTRHVKRRRTDKRKQQANVMAEEPLNQLAIAATPNGDHKEVRPQIFKLDVDCVEEMFDWLSINDINSVAETCIRMQRITGDYFQPTLATLELKYDGEFKMLDGHGNLNGFKEFIQRLQICKTVTDDGYRRTS